ncbi:MAG: type II toxin-antitoxin system HicA family toxin [Desulfomonile tiedjei]|uniref:Type II toxin-antitoxin system HicA family toxin n=1 Tax=Desulfomonile tiedjei TaxID=2358 RepID=A0A9D6Z3L4_9BACT|nr:type II toxin-antitoxin system HicA family toxin [Desulfomonile tiedjei]
MSRLPRIDGKTVVAALAKAGFEVTRVKGRHHFLRHADGRSTVVPVHERETIGPSLLSKIINDCDMTREEFDQLL